MHQARAWQRKPRIGRSSDAESSSESSNDVDALYASDDGSNESSNNSDNDVEAISPSSIAAASSGLQPPWMSYRNGAAINPFTMTVSYMGQMMSVNDFDTLVPTMLSDES